MVEEQNVEVFLARQAVFDRQRRVFGYELLFRSCLKNSFTGADASASTREVISNSLLSIGLDRIAGQKKVFVNIGRELLLDQFASFLPKGRIILEILDSADHDPEVRAACESLRQQGYLLALNAFVTSSEQRPSLKHAHFAKVDIRNLSDQDHHDIVREYHAQGVTLVAEKVETLSEYQRTKAAGYDYFQGFFFARPQMVIGRQIPAIKMNCLRLLREILRPELNYDRLAAQISTDVSLTYQLLRYVGSYLFSAGGRIDTVQQALVYLGENQLRRWVAVAAIPRALRRNQTGDLLGEHLRSRNPAPVYPGGAHAARSRSGPSPPNRARGRGRGPASLPPLRLFVRLRRGLGTVLGVPRQGGWVLHGSLFRIWPTDL